jgi:hypothetical protein
MSPTPRDLRDAFGTLERRLLVRRFAALNGRMRLLVLLVAGYVAAFAYWQARVPLDGIRRVQGEPRAALTLAIVLAAIAALGALTAGWRRASFAERIPGPDWLHLPLPPADVAAHLAREAGVVAIAGLVPGIAVLVAAAGLVSGLQLAAIAAGYALATALFAWLAVTLAARSTRARAGRRGLPGAAREVLAAHRRAPAKPNRAPVWRNETAWRAVARLDGLTLGRPSAARTRVVIAAAWFVAGAAAWFAPAPPLTRRALSYAAFAAGAATLGAWTIARRCADPAAVFRPLPIGIGDLWRARATRVTLALAAVAVLDALLAWSLPPLARVGVVMTFLPSGLAIALLGLNYGLTLPPHRMVAENLYYGWLCVAMVASWMIPFLGWGVLVAGLVHSALRLSRAPRMEEA